MTFDAFSVSRIINRALDGGTQECLARPTHARTEASAQPNELR
jgi:hypothetical protein